MIITNKEAIEKIRERICCEEPIQHFCNDSCMYGINLCEFDIAIRAIEMRIPKSPSAETFYDHVKVYGCPKCKSRIYATSSEKVLYGSMHKYCPDCGQALKWEDKR